MIKQKNIIVSPTDIMFTETKAKMNLYQFLNDCESHRSLLQYYQGQKLTIKLFPIPHQTEKAFLKLLQQFNIEPKISKNISIKTIQNLNLKIGIGITSILLLITYYQNTLITKKTMELENLKIQIEQNTLINNKQNQIHNTKLANILPSIFQIPITVSRLELDEKKLNLYGVPFNQSQHEDWTPKLPHKKILLTQLAKNKLKITLENTR